jgi:hypothetical protein
MNGYLIHGFREQIIEGESNVDVVIIHLNINDLKEEARLGGGGGLHPRTTPRPPLSSSGS